jgi:hypothetical protein
MLWLGASLVPDGGMMDGPRNWLRVSAQMDFSIINQHSMEAR